MDPWDPWNPFRSVAHRLERWLQFERVHWRVCIILHVPMISESESIKGSPLAPQVLNFCHGKFSIATAIVVLKFLRWCVGVGAGVCVFSICAPGSRQFKSVF